MRFVVVGGQKLQRMGCDHWQTQTCRQLDSGRNVALVIHASGALKFNVEAMRKHGCQLQCDFARAGVVPLRQRLPQSASLCARQDDQTLTQLLHPRPLDHRLRSPDVLGVGPSDQLRKVQITLHVLHQQHHARRRLRIPAQSFKNYFGADQRFDAGRARRLIELDSAKEVVEVGNRQRRLRIGGRSSDDLINTIGAVNDGEFGVQTQVNKHAPL